jgi:hypothetical protein
MMYWFKRHLGDKSPLVVCNQFEELFAKLGNPQEMMMIRSPGTQGVTIFIALPTPDLVNAFAGFEPARFDEIPCDFACEIGNQTDLQELKEALNPLASGSFSAPLEPEANPRTSRKP